MDVLGPNCRHQPKLQWWGSIDVRRQPPRPGRGSGRPHQPPPLVGADGGRPLDDRDPGLRGVAFTWPGYVAGLQGQRVPPRRGLGFTYVDHARTGPGGQSTGDSHRHDVGSGGAVDGWRQVALLGAVGGVGVPRRSPAYLSPGGSRRCVSTEPRRTLTAVTPSTIGEPTGLVVTTGTGRHLGPRNLNTARRCAADPLSRPPPIHLRDAASFTTGLAAHGDGHPRSLADCPDMNTYGHVIPAMPHQSTGSHDVVAVTVAFNGSERR